MRMWNVPTNIMCRRHLLGEHLETHMFLGSIKKGINLSGYIRNHLVEVHNLKNRHDELVLEMKNRGYKHNSPMEDYPFWVEGKINPTESLNLLLSRCSECKKGGENK